MFPGRFDDRPYKACQAGQDSGAHGPAQEQARLLFSDLAAETPRVGARDVSDADHWRGSRSDHPSAFLACLRYPDDSPASEDMVRYRAFIRAMGLEPVIWSAGAEARHVALATAPEEPRRPPMPGRKGRSGTDRVPR